MNISSTVEAWTDHDRGVSPIIAVILMVGIVVILSAVIGTFVLDIGGSLQETAPEVTFSAEKGTMMHNEDTNSNAKQKLTTINLTHEGGAAVQRKNIDVLVEGQQAYATTPTQDHGDFYTNGLSSENDLLYPFDTLSGDPGPDTISAGDTTTLTFATDYVKDNGHSIDEQKGYVYEGDGSTEYAFIYAPNGAPPNDRIRLTDVQTLDSGTLSVVWSGDEGQSTILYSIELDEL